MRQFGGMRPLWEYLRALWSDWVARLSGIASVILGAIGAFRRGGLPSWSFWVAAAVCFVVATFRIWLKEYRALEVANAEIARVRRPPFSEERIQEVHAQYGKLNDQEKAALKKIGLVGQRYPQQMCSYLQDELGLSGPADVLPSIASKTSFVRGSFSGYYEINPTIKEALEAYLARLRQQSD